MVTSTANEKISQASEISCCETGSSQPAPLPPRVRLFDKDVDIKAVKVPFNQNEYVIPIATTAFGDKLYGVTASIMAGRNCNDTSAQHYHKECVKRFNVLAHNGVKIIHHLQELKQLSYKIHKTVFVTYDGLRMLFANSESKPVKQNLDQILALLKKFHEESGATTQATTIGASSKKHTHFANMNAATGSATEDDYVDEQDQHVHKIPRKAMQEMQSAPETRVLSEQQPQALQPDCDVGHSAHSTALIALWPKRCLHSNEEFENAVERYFCAPEILMVKKRMEMLEEAWMHESLLTLESAVNAKKPITGYVYALWNPLFVDLLKIGATFRTPAIRAHELSLTGLPESFQVIAEVQCRNPFAMEREVHAHYANVRQYGKKKEFFTLTRDEVFQYFQTLTKRAMHAPSAEDDARIKKRWKRMRRWRKTMTRCDSLHSRRT